MQTHKHSQCCWLGPSSQRFFRSHKFFCQVQRLLHSSVCTPTWGDHLHGPSAGHTRDILYEGGSVPTTTRGCSPICLGASSPKTAGTSQHAPDTPATARCGSLGPGEPLLQRHPPFHCFCICQAQGPPLSFGGVSLGPGYRVPPPTRRMRFLAGLVPVRRAATTFTTPLQSETTGEGPPTPVVHSDLHLEIVSTGIGHFINIPCVDHI